MMFRIIIILLKKNTKYNYNNFKQNLTVKTYKVNNTLTNKCLLFIQKNILHDIN